LNKQPKLIALAVSGELKNMLTEVEFPNLGPDTACLTTNPDLFFGETKKEIAAAKAVCSGCPVMEKCAKWAVPNEEFGVFGGLSANERTLLRGNRPPANPVEVEHLREQLQMFATLSANELHLRLGVATRTVIRWRNILRQQGLVG
jgi:WhiB family redox-sensing transcriptional regulator